MNKNSDILIGESHDTHTPAPLNDSDKVVLDAFYTKYGVLGAAPREKIEVLKKEIQARNFFALGGNETEEMELRANERIFLLKRRAH